MWDCPRPLVTGRGNGGSSPTPLPCPGAVLERYEPLVSDIRLWSKSILGHLGALRSVLEGVLPRQRALSDLHSKGGKTRAERHGVTDGDEERRGESRNQIHFGPQNCRPKDFGPPNLQASASRQDRFAEGMLRAQARCAGAYLTVKRVAFQAARTRAGPGGIVGPEGNGKARCRRSAGNRGARTKLVVRAAPSGRTSR